MKGLKVQALWYLRGASPVVEQGPGRRRRGGGPGTFAAGEASDAEPPADGSACVCREHCQGLEGRTLGRPEAPRAPNVPSVREELPPAGLCGASEHAGPCVTLNDLSHSRPP